MKINEWKERGYHVPIFDKEMFIIDSESNKETLLILHGYACSSYDYYKILPELSKHFRVIIPDLICFGSSSKPLHRYFSVIEQTDSITELLKVLKINKFKIFAHDYGSSVASEIISRTNANLVPFEIDELILSNYFLPLKFFQEENYTDLKTSSFSKNTTSMLSSFSVYMKTKKNSLYNEEAINKEEFENMWKLHACNDGIDIIDFISNYDGERKIFWNRWVYALEDTEIKTKILWGKKDIFTSSEIVESLSSSINNNILHFIEECGYFPMLEQPKKLTEYILSA